MTDLNSLARTLAERLTLDVAELPDRTSPDDWPEAMLITDSELKQMAEAVIREAIEKTLQHVEQISKHGWMDSLHFDYHLGEDVQDLTISQTTESCKAAHRCIDTDGECTAKEVLVLDATAIRSLKQSNSG